MNTLNDIPPPGENTRMLSVIDRIRAGDTYARAELVELTFERFRQIARQMLGRPGNQKLREKGIESAELVSETMLQRVFKENRDGQSLLDRQSFETSEAFVAAVVSHMRYCLLDFAAGRGDLAMRQRQFRPQADNAEPDPSLSQIADSTLDTAEPTQWVKLLEATERLAPQDRAIFDCRYLQRMSREETAEALGISTKTVTRRCRVVLEQLGTKA